VALWDSLCCVHYPVCGDDNDHVYVEGRGELDLQGLRNTLQSKVCHVGYYVHALGGGLSDHSLSVLGGDLVNVVRSCGR
jgi:hypothetical protein